MKSYTSQKENKNSSLIDPLIQFRYDLPTLVAAGEMMGLGSADCRDSEADVHRPPHRRSFVAGKWK